MAHARPAAVLLAAALAGALAASAGPAAGARPGHPARTSACQNGAEWPAGFRPYAPTSYWNRPMPSGAHPRLLPDSDAMVHRAQDGAPGRTVRVNAQGSGWDEGHPVVFTSARDPLVVPRCKTYCNPVYLTRPFRIPARARAGDGSDRHLAVVQPDGTEIDLWAVDQPERDWRDGDTIAFGSGNTCGNFFSGPGFGRETSTVGGACLGAGLIRAAELRAGTIPHALFTTVDCGAHAFVYPATQPIDNVCSGPGPHVPNGAHLWLDLSDAQIAALPVRGWEKTILRALHRYGAYVEDTGSGGERAHGLFAPWFEDDAQYSAFGRRNPLAAWAREQSWQPVPIRARTAAHRPTTWFTFSENWAPLDWASHLHVVDPCYARGAC
ncbi:MAG: hypothetical protein QOI11_155 [Candidatus Eremiobacteraeota bacterium]|nr:hypothetical protein [Candidatus Eremiobacteraeota bacterium]